MRHPDEAAPLGESPLHQRRRLEEPASMQVETDILAGKPREQSVEQLRRRRRGRCDDGSDICRKAPPARQRVARRASRLSPHDERLPGAVAEEQIEEGGSIGTECGAVEIEHRVSRRPYELWLRAGARS